MVKEVLKVVELRKRLGGKEVLKGVTLSVKEGETKVIIGPSGAGKSTLLRCVNLLLRPDSGKVFLDGEEVTARGVDPVKVRQRIGFVFQNFNLFLHMTALENVLIVLTKVKKLPMHEAMNIAKEALHSVGIEEEHWGKYPAQLSGGQQQRVAIARALAMEPRIIVLDEPTSALDPELIVEVIQVLENLSKKGVTMLVVTHELGFAAKSADSVAFMDDGQIIEEGPPEKILLNPRSARVASFITRLWELYDIKDALARRGGKRVA